MKMNQTYKLLIVIASLLAISSCGSEAQEADKTKIADIKDTPLQGKVVGEINGKAFSSFDELERPGKIRETSSGKSLNLTFTIMPASILTINEHAYKGSATYTGTSFKLLSLSDPKARFKNAGDNKLTILEDDDTHVKGSIEFATMSEKNEKVIINATFNLTKVIFDPNDQEALLIEIKENPSAIESLGELRSDKEFILKAIQRNPIAFRYADKSLREDEDFILKALQDNRKNFLLLMHADKNVKSDKGFALKAVEINPLVLNLLDKELKKDKDIIAASKAK